VTFAAFEIAAETGQPVELYEFAIGGITHRFTSNQVSVTVGSLLYTAIPIQRSRLERGSEEKLSVRLPSSISFTKDFILNSPGKRVVLILKRYHRNDPDIQVVVFFKGVVQSVSYVNEGREVEMLALPAQTAHSRPIPRFGYAAQCQHLLFDPRCKILETDPAFQKSLLVTAVSGNTITAQNAGSFGADFFEAGFVTSGGEHRMITAQAGDVLTLLVPFFASPISQTVLVHAGCKLRIVIDCLNKFNNVINYGGFPHVPTKNPFEGLD